MLLEKGGNGLKGLAFLELLGKWVVGQWYASLIFVVVQRRFEKGMKRR